MRRVKTKDAAPSVTDKLYIAKDKGEVEYRKHTYFISCLIEKKEGEGECPKCRAKGRIIIRYVKTVFHEIEREDGVIINSGDSLFNKLVSILVNKTKKKRCGNCLGK